MVQIDSARQTAPAPTRPAPAPARGASRRLGVIAVLISTVGMGLSGLFGRLATPEGAATGEALTLGRMSVGALGMVAILAMTGRLPQLKVPLSRSVVLGGLFLGLSLSTYLSATVLTDLSRAVVLHYLGPVLSTVLARVVLKERISPADALSLGVSFLGMMLAAGLLGADTTAGTEQDTLGTVLGAASGLFYGAALLCYRFRTDMPADARSFWNFTFGAVATAGMVAVVRPDLSGMTVTHWAWAGAFFLISGLLALGMLVVAGKHLRAAELSGLSFTEVIVATSVGALVFAEPFSLPVALGIVLILVAAVVPLVSGARRMPKAREPRPGPAARRECGRPAGRLRGDDRDPMHPCHPDHTRVVGDESLPAGTEQSADVEGLEGQSHRANPNVER